MAQNFLLGFGERLTVPMDPPPHGMEANIPYTFSESVSRLTPQFSQTVSEIAKIPTTACPDGETVFSVVLHPSYTAKSFYPQKLFEVLELQQVGSKGVTILPDKWVRKTAPHEVFSTEIFVSGKRSQIEKIPSMLRQLSQNAGAAEDLTKIEQIKIFPVAEKIIELDKSIQKPLLEIALQSTPNKQGSILRGFQEYLRSLDDSLVISDTLFSQGLCFLALKADKDLVENIALYSFVRQLRQMPRLRSTNPYRTVNLDMAAKLPNLDPVDPNLRVAIFDGGFTPSSDLKRWVNLREASNLTAASEDGENHGHMVSSAYLFGNIEKDIDLSQPQSHVDLYRVIDDRDDCDEDENLIKVLNRIKDILSTTNYQFMNFSIGPELPVADGVIDPWTSVLDDYLASADTLATFASGNAGLSDRDAGLSRVQSPADCVNGLSIGSADKQGLSWQRAEYSCMGPGRLSGYIKPDIVEFGGSTPDNMFTFYKSDNSGKCVQELGTSFAAPLALRKAVAIRNKFGTNLTTLGIRSLLIHSAIDSGYDQVEVGWGKIPDDINDIVTCGDDCIRVLYQGKLNPSEWLKVPIPLPDRAITGKVTIKATLCFTTLVDPQDPVNYTRSGLEVVFRPHSERRSKPKQIYADSESFFKSSILHGSLDDSERRKDAHKWETVRSASLSKYGNNLLNPEFNVHYIPRDGGNSTKYANPIPYSMVVEVRAPRETSLYSEVVNRFRSHLEILRPNIRVDVRV